MEYNTEVTLEEVEVQVHFNYTPGYPEVRTLPNGDPGYPAEGPELEVFFIAFTKRGKNNRILVSPNIIEYLPTPVIESIADDLMENWEPDELD